MKRSVSVRRLLSEDAAILVKLRREALEAEPFAFAATAMDDVALVVDSVRGFLKTPETQVVYGAFDDRDDLVGMAGLVRGTKVKERHKATVWGMYVKPAARRAGVGRRLLTALVERARTWSVHQVHLCVTEAAPAAQALYESAGFVVWGTEPRALRWNGRFVADHHLVLVLDTTAPDETL